LAERQEKLTGIRLSMTSKMKGTREWWQEDISLENYKYFVQSLRLLTEKAAIHQRHQFNQIWNVIYNDHQTQQKQLKDFEQFDLYYILFYFIYKKKTNNQHK